MAKDSFPVGTTTAGAGIGAADSGGGNSAVAGGGVSSSAFFSSWNMETKHTGAYIFSQGCIFCKILWWGGRMTNRENGSKGKNGGKGKDKT